METIHVHKRCKNQKDTILSFLLLGKQTKEKHFGFIQTLGQNLSFSLIFLGTVLSSKLLNVSLPQIKMSKYHFLQHINLVCL